MMKRLVTLVLSFMMLATAFTGVVATSEQDEVISVSAMTKAFDAETVLWTNNPIENVLAEGGIYQTMKEVNPNAAKTEVPVQKPYEKAGVNFNGWGYSEYIWTNGYPVGNGRMASMVAGGIDNEVIQINEDTCWDGSPYGTLKNEKGETLTTIEQTRDAETIEAVDMTSGSVKDNWRYFRGAKADGTPADIGSADAIVGDEAFRNDYPDFANKSISNQALNISNAKEQTAVQNRWSLHSMVEAKFLGNPTGQRAYKSFVELYLDFGHNYKFATNYTKNLDMTTGIVTVDYDYLDMNDRTQKHFTRETFASYPDQAVVTHVTSDSPLDFTAELHTYHNQDGYYKYEKVSNKQVKVIASVYNGNKDNNIGRINVIKFEADMLLDGDGAFAVSDDNTTVSVKGGNEATIYVVGATNYVNYKKLDNSKPTKDCAKYIANLQSKTYDTILDRHIADFNEQFNSSSLTLDNINNVDNYLVPTEKRVRKDVNGKSGYTVASGATLDTAKGRVSTTYQDGDNQLATLEFNYGKYMMVSGARDERTAAECGADDIEIPMSQPLNLTGKWNAAMSAGWNGKYTININTEMNYWAAQPLNVGATEKTLIDTFADLAESGSITAAYQYGVFNDRGDSSYQPGDPWVMHHNYDLWRGTQPIDNATAGLWPTGGAWLLDHAWQYYKFNLDKEYLAEVYPYMVGAAKFFTQFLVIDPKTGYLITAASCSPEQGGVQPGPAMDTQLVRNLYDMVQQASEILGKTQENAALLAKIAEQMPSSYLADEDGKVAPNLIDSKGYIKEWTRGDVSFDFNKKTDESGTWKVSNPFKPSDTTKSLTAHEASNDDGHRHMSHLWELFPGTHLSAYSDDANEQKIYKAFQDSITKSKRLTADGKGWSLAWRMNLLARALDGNNASSKLEQLFVCRTAPNLLDEHPDFQIDGNYGATSGITEMLLQSHDGNINILPALPNSWKSGEFKDFRARGDVGVSAKWQDGKFIKAELKPENDGDLNVIVADITKATVTDSKGAAVTTSLNSSNKIMTFAAKAGEKYTISTGNPDVSKPVTTDKPIPTPDPTIDPDATPAPTATPDPTQPPLPDNWTCAKGDSTKKTDDYVMKNLSLVFDVSASGSTNATIDGKSFTNYISSGSNGSWSNGKGTGTALKYTADRNGKLTVYVVDLGNNKELCVTKEGVSDSKQNVPGEAVYFKNETGAGISKSASIDVTAGSTYYAYVAGSKGRFVGAEFVASAEQPTLPPSNNFVYEITKAEAAENGNVSVELDYKGTDPSPTAKLIVAEYLGSDKSTLVNSVMFDVNGTDIDGFYYVKPAENSIKIMVWDGTDNIVPLAEEKTVAASAAVSTPDPTLVPTQTPAPKNGSVSIGETKYNTVREAVEAVAANPPKSEAERVYIDLMPGVYREQVVVSTPYVTIRRKPVTNGETKLTWYYGLGSLYDSCNDQGYYDPSVIGDGKAYGPTDWGTALKVDKSATGFIAENLYIENSYNAYYTQEELTDITGVDPKTDNSNFHRLEWIQEQIKNGKSDDEINTFLQSRTAITYKGVESSSRERSAALHCSADKAQFINCTVMSTQDTIGINTGRMYFKNCKLGGTTDYICGSATAVFDNCELYTNAGQNGSGGESATITAPANGAESEGYLFWNCRITGTKYSTAGSLGRPWGTAPGPAAYYINTTIGEAGISDKNDKYLIAGTGWSDMSGNKAVDARFGEYGSVYADGTAADLSKRTKGKVLSEWTMLRFNQYTFTKGADGWDPAGVSQNYTGVNQVINTTTIDTSDSATNSIALPSAPSGYEFSWESDSEFAVVNGNKIDLIRPAYGEAPIKATVKLYARDAANKGVGAEKIIKFEIQPSSDTTNVFTVSGSVTLSVASDTDQTVTVQIKKSGVAVKTQNVVIPAGATTAQYTAANIPAGTYTVTASTENADYNIITDAAEIIGVAGDTKTFNVEAKKMQTIKVESPDFDKAGYIPSVTAAIGFSAEVYTASGNETANIGDAGNKVYKLTKDNGVKVASGTGVSFDIKSMLPSGSGFENTKTIKFSYDFLMESIDLMPSDYSYFDLATSKTNAGADAEDMTRFVRWGVHTGWKQLNMFPSKNSRINGDNTQFNKNNTMANKWYRIVADINIENQTITTTIYDRDWKEGDNGTYILNKAPFKIAAPDEEGNNINYPTNIDLNNLYFNIYMDKKDKQTSTKMEYYFDNITVEYQDYE